jgi:hypothetical protein
MLLIGYRMLFGEMCTLLNVHVDPDADYVEDDLAREKLEKSILMSIQHTELSIIELSDNVYYLGLSKEICRRAFPPVEITRKMSERIAACSILFRRELRKIGLFKHLDRKDLVFPEPHIIQCDRTR